MTRSTWVKQLNPGQNGSVRLFCLPHAGGGASSYRRWANRLPESIELCPIQLPGREDRFLEPAATALPELVRLLADALVGYLDKPFAVFGHSMGALLGFELVRQLRARDQPMPIHLFVSGHGAPHIPDTETPLFNLDEAALLEELKRLDGVPQEVLEHRELLQLVLPILRADCELCDTYRYVEEDPLSCPITAFGGVEDPRVSRSSIQAWSQQTIADFELTMLPGGHFFLHSAESLVLRGIARQVHAGTTQ